MVVMNKITLFSYSHPDFVLCVWNFGNISNYLMKEEDGKGRDFYTTMCILWNISQDQIEYDTIIS